jgi:hypothetical protein
VLLGALAVASAVHAQSLAIGVDEGSQQRPIATFDGTRWSGACIAPAPRGGDSAPSRIRLTATGGTPVATVRLVPANGAEWVRLAPHVTRHFDERARRENVSAAALARVPLVIEAIFTSGDTSPPRIYFFSASKTVPDTRGPVDADDDGEVDPPGDLRIDVSGWLDDAAGVTSLGTNSTLTWEQVDARPAPGTRRSMLTPIGVVRVADRRVWVLQGRAGDSVWYTLYAVNPSAATRVLTLVRADARSC